MTHCILSDCVLCNAVPKAGSALGWLTEDKGWLLDGIGPLSTEQVPRCRQNIFCARKYICLCDEKSSANVFKSGKGHSRDHFRTALKIATLSALCRCCLHSKCRIGYDEGVRMMVIFARILSKTTLLVFVFLFTLIRRGWRWWSYLQLLGRWWFDNVKLSGRKQNWGKVGQVKKHPLHFPPKLNFQNSSDDLCLSNVQCNPLIMHQASVFRKT